MSACQKSHLSEKDSRVCRKPQSDEKDSRACRKPRPGEDSCGSRGKLRSRSVAAAAAAVGMAAVLLWILFLHQTRIVWSAEMLAYSGYTAEEHVETFETLPEGRLLFNEAQAGEDGSVVITVTQLQRIYYRKRYRRMLAEALSDAEKQGVDAQVSGDYRSITYFAGDYRTFYEAGLALLRVEAMTSCLQAERNRPDTPWKLTIRIYRDHTDARPLTAFSLPEETMEINAKMWDCDQ